MTLIILIMTWVDLKSNWLGQKLGKIEEKY